MNETAYLTGYDPLAFTPLAVACDLVLLTIRDRRLAMLLVKRTDHPALGRFALPGTFVRETEDLADTARRALNKKVGLDRAVRQFRSFGRIDRDPRMRVVSIGYMALATAEQLAPLLDANRCLVTLGEDGSWLSEDGAEVALPFDHADIAAAAIADLRGQLDQSSWAYGLLDAAFSLRELQQVHEAVRGHALNKPAFRKRLIDSGWIEPTGELESGKGFRPAELYRVRAEHLE